MKKRIAMIMTAISILVGAMYVPVSAQVVEDVNQTTEAEEQKEAQKETETKETKKEDEKSETNKEDALTPNGNMTLVDNTTSSSGSKQFLTLTSRDGNFYYLIIDHDKDGNENVHFLNQVDERDLMGLMEEKEAKALEDEIAEKEAVAAAEKALRNQTQTNSVKTAANKTPVVERDDSKKKVLAAAGLVALLAAGAATAFVLKKKKGAEPEKEDPDANYEEDDFGVELDMMDEEDFDNMDDM